MKDLRTKLDDILELECLSDQERKHLKNVFTEFFKLKEIINRNEINQTESSNPDWLNDNVG